MFSNHRKTIGVVAEAVINEFPKLLCQGIIRTATEKGYNVAIFSPYGKYGNNEEYFKGDTKLCYLPPYEDLDGIVLALDTIQEKGTIDTVIEQVRSKCHCPVVSVREFVEGTNNLYVDNKSCMEGIIRHFIEVHKFRRLCFMTGPAHRWDSRERLECFERIMAEYHLPVEENQKFYGDFWKGMGKEACDCFLSGSELPEAIICANDHMAAAVASELLARGLRIPEDICVSGYDGLSDTMYFTPSITTVGVPFYEMGVKAIEIIDKKQDCPDQTEDYCFDVHIIARESCGCQPSSNQDVIMNRRNWLEEINIERNRKNQFNFFSISLGNCHTIDELGQKISHYIFNIDGFQDYCICFCDDLEKRTDFSDYSDTMELRIAFQNRKNIGAVQIPFNRRELLPAEMTSEEPQVWYFVPLHFENKTFGYEAIQFMTPEVTANMFSSWSIILGNKVQDILIYHEMQRLIIKLEDIYNRDELTGMYNRRGLKDHSETILEHAKTNQIPLFLAIIDLDGMKQINDIYGHVEGDYALKTIRDAIQNACRDKIVNARTGGDEFVILAENITEEEGVSCLKEIENFLERFNESGTKPYSIHASYGYLWKVPSQNDSMETYVKESDKMMYKNKIENKRRRGEPLR